MITLNWIFTNGLRMSRQFDTMAGAEDYIYDNHLIGSGTVDRVWVDAPYETFWIKEKVAA